MKAKITVKKSSLLADLQTPVAIYLKVRDIYPQSVLLESSDYHSSENSFSFIGVAPIARFSVRNGKVTMQYPDGEILIKEIKTPEQLPVILDNYIRNFDVTGETDKNNGFFGYTAYDAVKYFENIEIGESADELSTIPEMTYLLYRFIIAVNHLRNDMTIMENLTENSRSQINELISVIDSRNFPTYDFHTRGETASVITDDEYKNMVQRGIEHCLQGNVSQVVLSRRFERPFIGDDFKVYRALRSINPSPYLFYFDFGSYRIFGSSPETHLKIEGDLATIDPIAGTVHRTGDDKKDEELARQLLADPKENTDHSMLVDHAINDLSRNATDVKIKSYKQVQFYSHVIHLVSRVTGRVAHDANRISLFAGTLPAGTLSGTPKVQAMQLINELERHPRGFYGGCIGCIGFDGGINHAITIRSFLSVGNKLYFQAGAGIIAESNPENELAEVNNKLGALNRAIELANELKQ
jgi:anthranilate synthase component 1